METTHVFPVYERIAEKFNKTRVNHWSYVRKFLDELPSHSVVADIGTGNGKYLNYRKDITLIGNDTCQALLDIINKTNNSKTNIIQANGIHLPYRQNSFDAAISIAVLHHVSTPEMRKKFLLNIIQSLKPNGTALIVVWAREQNIKSSWKQISGNDYFIPWVDTKSKMVYDRYYHLFSKNEIEEMFLDLCEYITIKSIDYECDNWCIVVQKT